VQRENAQRKEALLLEQARKKEELVLACGWYHFIFQPGCLFESDHVTKCFSRNAKCILACGGEATIILNENVGLSSTAGLPVSLYNKLKGRQKHLPSPDYVALGAFGRYYIRFSDGKY
jgi:hypothetical protein